jgi:CarD family transcriptional regulator
MAELTIKSGSKVIYPRLGICQVDGVVERDISGTKVKFYSLKPIDQESVSVLVPIKKAEEVGVRSPIARAEVPKLLRFLSKDIEIAKDYRKRNARNAEHISSGEIFKVADSLKAMNKLSKGKTLSPEEQQTASRARRLLVSEIAYVTKLPAPEVEALIDNALAGKRIRIKSRAA